MPSTQETCTCTNCRAEEIASATFEVRNARYCQPCYVELFQSCAVCHQMIRQEGLSVVQHTNSQGYLYLCEYCNEQHSVGCGECGMRMTRGMGHGATDAAGHGIHLCNECTDNYFMCDTCHRYHSLDRHIASSGNDLCTTCYERREGRAIQDYSARAPQTFFGKGRVFFGVELEVESANDDIDRVREARKVKSVLGEFAICKSDGSLDDGFEIVTCPATIDAHKEHWDKFFKERWSNLRSYDTSTCGLHIHVSRQPLSEMQVAKIIIFVNSPHNRKFIERIAGRGSAHYAQIREKKWVDVRQPRDRYEAVNLCNKHTIEFRLFKGTLNKDSFFKALEFASALVEFCAPCETTIRTFQNIDSFISFVDQRKKKYPYLHNFIKNKLHISASQLQQEYANQ